MRNVKYRPLYLIKSKFTGEYYTCIKLDVFVSNVTFDLYTKQHDINNYRYSWNPPGKIVGSAHEPAPSVAMKQYEHRLNKRLSGTVTFFLFKTVNVKLSGVYHRIQL